MAKNKKISVDGVEITISEIGNQNFISLTDMVRNRDNGLSLIEKWIRNKNTLEFLAVWESMNNQNFNSPEFEGIRSEAGSNRFTISVKQWVEKTNAVGIFSKSGRYGGTYAHKDIAFEFATWISPVFKLYLIKEFERLKEIEQGDREWDIKRVLSKVNYKIHTDAVKDYIIPKSKHPLNRQWIEYADEADLLNVALFGCTSKEWRVANQEKVPKSKNIRDYASVNELVILTNIESLNAEMIKEGIAQKERFKKLVIVVKEQKLSLEGLDFEKSLNTIENKKIAKAQSKFNQDLIKGLGFNTNKGDEKKGDK